jgi:mRNA-degrading endonuclease RelE of RelBE toxin-antitoxin system
LSLYSVEFDSRALDEAVRLPIRLRRRLKEGLEYLRAAPSRSHPSVLVKEIRDLRGVWRFHLDRHWRVFYITIESRLLVVLIDRSAGIDKRILVELKRRRR